MFLHSGLLKQCDLFTEMTPHMIEMLVMKARAASQQPVLAVPCASKHRMGRGLPYSPAPLNGGSNAIFAFVTTARGISLDFAEAKSAQGQSIGRSIHCGTHPNNGR
jgi:hypothetical protein